jgi:putative flippase GtrA
MKALLRKHATKVRFGLVGAANTALDFGLLLVLANFFAVPHVIANIISSSIAFVSSFFANKKYTFKTTGQSVVREMILFTVVTLFGLWVIQSAIIALLTPPIQAIVTNDTITLVIAKLVATLASLTWNYILYSRIVFKTSH